MRLVITSTCEQALSYKIYKADGKKRRLLKSGKFKQTTEQQLTSAGGDVILRVSVRRGIKPLLGAFYVFFFSLFSVRRGIPKNEQRLLNCFHEIRLRGVGEEETLELRFTPSPLVGSYFVRAVPQNHLETEYLTCSTHPYVREIGKNKAYAAALTLIPMLLLIALVLTLTLTFLLI